MKNLLTKLIVAVLCLCMVLAFAACNDSSPASNDDDNSKPSSSAESEPEVVTIVGKWEGALDISNTLGLDEETLSKYSSYNLDVKITYEFAEDGKYSVSLDGEGIRDGVKAIYKDELLPAAAAEYGMTVEQLVSTLGTTEDKYLDTMVDTMLTALSQGSGSGKYKFEDSKLFSVEDGEEFKEGNYTLCELTASTLKLKESYENGELVEEDSPEIVFTKVK